MPELNGRDVSAKTFVKAKLKTPKVLAVIFLLCAFGYALTLLPQLTRYVRTLLPDWVNQITWDDFKFLADILCAILAVCTIVSMLAIYARCEILRRWKREKASAHLGRRSLKEQFLESEPCDLYPDFNLFEAILYVLFARRVPVWDLAQVDAFGEPFKDRVEVMDRPQIGREKTPYTFDESHGGGPRGLDSPPRGILAAVAPLKRAVVRNATTAYGPFARIMSKMAGATQQSSLTRPVSKVFSKAAGVMEQSDGNDRNNPEKEPTSKGELRSGMSIEHAFKLCTSGSYFRIKTINSRVQWLRKTMRSVLGSKGKNYFVVQLHSAKHFLLVYESELSAAHEAKMFFTLKQLKTASVSFERGELLIHDYFEELDDKADQDEPKQGDDDHKDNRKKLLLHDIPGSFLSALTISIQHLASRGMRD